MNRYQQRKKEGLCVRCGHSKPIEGKVECSFCNKKSNFYYKQNRYRHLEQKKEYYHKLKSEGICPKCKQKHNGDTVSCETCLRKERDRWGVK